MNPIVQFSPKEYVRKLHCLAISGYTGATDGKVAVSRYTSANLAFGGNTKVTNLYNTLADIVKSKREAMPDFGRLLGGQGQMQQFIDFLSLIDKYSDDFKTKLPQYFPKDGTKGNLLQAMLDDSCPGMDCVGFVGTYLKEAGAYTNYPSYRPLDYAQEFTPVTDLSQVKDLAIVMLTNGMHVQIIDRVTERTEGSGFILVDLCQSSSLKDQPDSMGPQCNKGVRISSGGGKYLPVEKFRSDLTAKTTKAEYEANEEERKQKPDYKLCSYDAFKVAAEAELRKSLTTDVDAKFKGYQGGCVFQLASGGTPTNPVSGSVYIGVARNGLSVKTPPAP